MKLLHISDLHLGKRVNEFSMLEDQREILEQILDIAEKEKAEGVMIAGDVYDKPVPPLEAVRLLDAFLNRLADLGIPVFLISGNHDSRDRLSFGAEMFRKSGIYMAGEELLREVPQKDGYGEISFWLLPFLKPAVVKAAYPEEAENIVTYTDAVRTVLQKAKIDFTKRNILIAHQFAAGAAQCESEEVAIGGLDQVDVSAFDGFDYVALGHLHRPQHVEKETIRYCGTPLKYSFSEAKDKKSVTVLELGGKGKTEIRTVPLVPKRDMKEIRGTYMELSGRKFYSSLDRNAYYHITLTDEEDVMDALSKLRLIYPNMMKLTYDNTRVRAQAEYMEAEQVEKKQPLTLLDEFYEKQNGQPLSGAQKEIAGRLLEEIWEEGI